MHVCVVGVRFWWDLLCESVKHFAVRVMRSNRECVGKQSLRHYTTKHKIRFNSNICAIIYELLVVFDNNEY